MGNQPSKGHGNSTPRASGSQTSLDKGADLRSYPSFSKADTKESVRSFRGALRSKIPGSGGNKGDSPRNSVAGLSIGDADKSDVASVRSGRSALSANNRPDRSDSPSSAPQSPEDTADDNVSPSDDYEPPPSPVQSASIRHGHHEVDAAQRSGEVDHVSDQPPTGIVNSNAHLQRPGAPILVKKPNTVNNVQRDDFVPSPDGGTTPSTMLMNDIKDNDVDDYIKRLLDAGYAGKSTKNVCLKNAEITSICTRARELFLEQPPLLELEAPVKIVGDIHGQYSDLIRLFEMCGFPPSANFLFLGDYVDRGKHSLETILLLLCYKIKFPDNFFLLRGNHECANVTRVYGFYDECKRRCNVKVWKTFIDTFNCVGCSFACGVGLLTLLVAHCGYCGRKNLLCSRRSVTRTRTHGRYPQHCATDRRARLWAIERFAMV